MSLYDEKEAIAHVKALHPHGKMHLSHVVRNGLMNILSTHSSAGTFRRPLRNLRSDGT